MPITIGKKQEGDFKNPLVLLTDCHRRIEHFFHMLIAVTKQAHGRNLTADQRSALEVALRYFREAAPRHTQDEEESLFPRLRKSSQQEVKEKMAMMDHLHSDHQKMEIAHNNIDRWIRQWLDQGQMSEQAVRQLTETLAELDSIYQEHIALEDREIFPMAARTMETKEIEAVGREMAARRGIDLESQGL